MKANPRTSQSGIRSVQLSPADILSALDTPILRDLLVTRIGFGKQGPRVNPEPDTEKRDTLLLATTCGEGWLFLRDKQWLIPPDTVAFIPARQPHLYGRKTPSSWELFRLHFTGKQAGYFLNGLGVSADRPLIPVPAGTNGIETLKTLFEVMKESRSPGHCITASGLLISLFGAWMPDRAKDPPSRDRPTVREEVHETLTYLQTNTDRPPAVEVLARMSGLSPRQYASRFKEIAGCSPLAYSSRLRIRKACALLDSTSCTVKEAAARLGFADPYYFSRCFRKVTGLSPAQYRTRHTRPRKH